MVRFILQRLLFMIPTLFIISVIGFVIVQAPPGDFVTSYVAALEAQGDYFDREYVDGLRARFGLGKPWYVQYWRWASNFAQGDLGYSMSRMEPVSVIIMDRLPLSFAITFLSFIIVYTIGMSIGVYSATHKYTLADYVVTFVGFLGVAVPAFLIALIGLWLTFKWTGKVNFGLYSPEMQNAPFNLEKALDLLDHIWLPALIVGTTGTAGLIRTMRANLLDELPKQYVMVARARGVGPIKLILKYPMRIAINPVISNIGYMLPALVEGEVLVSMTLGLPTLAPVLLQGLIREDMLLVASIVMILAFLVVLGTLVSDILLAIVDPRIRKSV